MSSWLPTQPPPVRGVGRQPHERTDRAARVDDASRAIRTERMCGVADLNCDGQVNGPDLGLLLGAWGQTGAAFDLTGDNHTDGADVGVLLGAWGN